jgi:tetratricopeptide (TPR) repeat protein
MTHLRPGVLGTSLRLHALGERSLWGDEIAQAVWARESLPWIYRLLRPSFEAALGTYLLHFFRLLGESEFLLRLPGVLFGILSLALIYRLGRRLFDSVTGVLAALLLAVSPFHLTHSQEVHPYTLVVLLTLLSVDFFVAAIRQPTWGRWLSWLTATALGLYAHPFVMFVFAAEMVTGTFLALREWARHSHRAPLARLLLGGVLVVLLWLPEIVPALPDLLGRSTHWDRAVSETVSVGPQRAVLADLSGMIGDLAREFSGAPKLLPIQLPLLAVGILAAWFRKQRTALLLCLLVLMLPLTTAPFRSSSLLFYPRYFIFMLPAFLILIARGASALVQVIDRWIARLLGGRGEAVYRAIMPVILSSLILVGSIAPVRSYFRKGNHDWRSLARYLEQNVRDGDVVIQTWIGQPYSLAWYFQPTAGVKVLQAPELPQRSSEVPGEVRVWWVFIQQAQLKLLQDQMADGYEIAVFYGLSVLNWKQGMQRREAALDATIQMLELESEIHTDQRKRYPELVALLVQQEGWNLAKFCLDQGDRYRTDEGWKEAVESYQRAIVYQPAWGMAHTRLGYTYRLMGETTKSQVSFQKSIEVDARYLGAYVQLGSLYESLDQASQALVLYQEAVALDPNSPWAHSALGSLYVRLGEPEQALDHLQRAVALDPQNAVWLLALADAYRNLNRVSEALQAYQEVLVLDPNNQRATEALRALEP